jgi:hypothetical protein
MREVTDNTDHFNAKAANDLLTDREAGEAYCRAIPDNQYVVYFPSGGEVSLNLSGLTRASITWYDVLSAESEDSELNGSEKTLITAPGPGHWIAVIN